MANSVNNPQKKESSGLTLAVLIVVWILSLFGAVTLGYYGLGGVTNTSGGEILVVGEPQEIDISAAMVHSPPEDIKGKPLTIVEFGNYGCAFCRLLHNTLGDFFKKGFVELDLPKKDGSNENVKIPFQFAYFDLGKTDSIASLSTLAAGKQDKFWEYQDLVYREGKNMDVSKAEEFAKRLNLDMPRFKADMADSSLKSQIQKMREQARKLRVGGTPAVFIEGYALKTNNRDQESYKKVIQYLILQQK